MIAIINGCGANIASVQFALERAGKKSLLTIDKDVIQSASHVILPGVGTARHAMTKLNQSSLIEVVCGLKQPVLGICLGMQILHSFSQEGTTDCLKILPQEIIRLNTSKGLPVPHMGWNRLQISTPSSPLLEGVPTGSHVYFVHSFAAQLSENTIATVCYGNVFSAAVNYKNFYGVQFHPERSGTLGERILQNFLALE